MKKIPTLYERIIDNYHNARICGDYPREGLEWVEKGEGIPTVKRDGTCTAIINCEFYKRYDAKNNKPIRENDILCQDAPDPITGHFPVWRLCDRSDPDDKHLWEAFDNYCIAVSKFDGFVSDGTHEAVVSDGTHEAVGPS